MEAEFYYLYNCINIHLLTWPLYQTLSKAMAYLITVPLYFLRVLLQMIISLHLFLFKNSTFS